jgi:hypothetical protein
VSRARDPVKAEVEKRRGEERANYKLQNTKYKQITNPKLQITNKVARSALVWF